MFDATPAEALYSGRLPAGWGGRWYGCYPATVIDIVDPDGAGRIKVALPWSPDGGGARYEAWARLATLFAGNVEAGAPNAGALLVRMCGYIFRPVLIKPDLTT